MNSLICEDLDAKLVYRSIAQQISMLFLTNTNYILSVNDDNKLKKKSYVYLLLVYLI